MGMSLLEEILEKDYRELLAYVTEQSEELGIDFDVDMLDGEDKMQALYDFIGANIDTNLQGYLHSECRLEPGCPMFPNAETQEELDEELEHLLP